MLRKIFKTPIKVLRKARDFYLKGMENLAAPAFFSLKSCSVNYMRACDNEVLRQLLCVASTEIMEGEVQPNGMATYYIFSVGKIGRIEENKPCSFRKML
ncbi:hypothetical protein WN944_028607 [Citrus x changshan-huyou]|uniref:Uncharacterized protein n=1 Tax=Citrus x changshan-huyou TaxID=2935761 RepID=A0AAP0LN20_9ROSI